ncbi:hypothetical protein JHK87_015725 [Glycine soja]|nr:hypothetical protein JHK87_015725 [Glycine soja]
MSQFLRYLLVVCCFCILHVESSKIGTGILNSECAVLPPGNSREAMPLEATIITILLYAFNELANVFQMNVFPVPPYPYRKNMSPSSFLTA